MQDHIDNTTNNKNTNDEGNEIPDYNHSYTLLRTSSVGGHKDIKRTPKIQTSDAVTGKPPMMQTLQVRDRVALK